ncbi:MAG TPA: hypothetical protein VLV18_08985 [Terriglobales bacterium]|nr:hypothetical protein [Terriglobales bacterium]
MRLRWNLLQGIVAIVVFLSFAFIGIAIPPQFSMARIAAVFAGLVFSMLASFRSSILWCRIALLTEVFFFATSLVAATFSSTIAAVVPLLLLAFMMILFTDRILNQVACYRLQFSVLNDRLFEFNAPVIERSLEDLYRRVARNGVIFAGCCLLTILILLAGFDLSRVAPILSDASVYILVVSMSLALLVSTKEE